MIICGGKSNGYMNDLYSFDFSMLFSSKTKNNKKYLYFIKLETKEWTEIIPQGKERISRRYGHSAVIYNDSMYIVGGYDDFGLTCNDLWEFSFSL